MVLLRDRVFESSRRSSGSENVVLERRLVAAGRWKFGTMTKAGSTKSRGALASRIPETVVDTRKAVSELMDITVRSSDGRREEFRACSLRTGTRKDAVDCWSEGDRRGWRERGPRWRWSAVALGDDWKCDRMCHRIEARRVCCWCCKPELGPGRGRQLRRLVWACGRLGCGMVGEG